MQEAKQEGVNLPIFAVLNGACDIHSAYSLINLYAASMSLVSQAGSFPLLHVVLSTAALFSGTKFATKCSPSFSSSPGA